MIHRHCGVPWRHRLRLVQGGLQLVSTFDTLSRIRPLDTSPKMSSLDTLPQVSVSGEITGDFYEIIHAYKILRTQLQMICE